jgi:hypothetical protein
MENTGSWDKYQMLVLDKLEKLEQGQNNLHDKVSSLTVDTAVIKAEAKRDATWVAGIGSAIGIALSSGIHFIFKQ